MSYDATRDVPAYIATHPVCGHVRMAAVDDRPGDKDLAKELADCVRRGLVIERVTVGVVRDLPINDEPGRSWGGCAQCDKKKQKKAKKGEQLEIA